VASDDWIITLGAVREAWKIGRCAECCKDRSANNHSCSPRIDERQPWAIASDNVWRMLMWRPIMG